MGLENIAIGKETKEKFFTRLYKEVFPSFARYISGKNGSLEEAQDAFQEALVIYYEKVILGTFQPGNGHGAYLFGIAKNQWLNQANRTLKKSPSEAIEVADEPAEHLSVEKLATFLQSAGERCMDILQSFYYENLTMKALSQRFGFASERSATVQKYKCLEKIREQVKEKSLQYEDFTY